MLVALHYTLRVFYSLQESDMLLARWEMFKVVAWVNGEVFDTVRVMDVYLPVGSMAGQNNLLIGDYLYLPTKDDYLRVV